MENSKKTTKRQISASYLPVIHNKAKRALILQQPPTTLKQIT